METQTEVSVDFEKVITEKAEKTRKLFQALLEKTNKDNPAAKDVQALAELLSGNKKLELWRDVLSAGHLAEIMVIEHARATPAVKECWKQRLQALKRDLGTQGAPLLEQLLIQQAALCWLRLNLVELSYSSTMSQSITLTLGIYWEKRLSAAQKRFTQACETLTRVQTLVAQYSCAASQYCSSGRTAVERFWLILRAPFLFHATPSSTI